MTEVRREQILEERAEEKQLLQNSRQIADLVRQQRTGAANTDESVSRAAKRAFLTSMISCSMVKFTTGQHTARGATKEKASKLDELKAKRKAKDDKKRVRCRSFRLPLLASSVVVVKGGGVASTTATAAGTVFVASGHGYFGIGIGRWTGY